MQATKNYIAALSRIDFSIASETSLRTAFENYLTKFIEEAQLQKFKVLQEGKRIGAFGVPDFRISFNDSMIGYIETKKMGENLDKILQTEQIRKYRELSPNLLITNYVEFVWIKDEMIQHERLLNLPDFENLADFKNVEKLLIHFFSQVPEKISLPKHLALALAVRARNLKDFIYEELTRQNQQNEQAKLYDLYTAFKDNIFAELSISEFADAYAQMLAYGLFLSGLNADTKTINRINAKHYVPVSFQLIKELFDFFEELEKPEYKDTKWIIDEIIAIINNIQWADLKQNMRFNPKNLTESLELSGSSNDPYIYFYETFLATYDFSLRKAKGVYYTPPQVVNFIVRAIDELLINTFHLSSGLADRSNVTVLDFATGTGTFLLEIFKIILEKRNLLGFENQTGLKSMLIQEHLLKNLYGFEYLIAPYTIAHLKLSQFLIENNYQFQEKDRLQVYLTNTLEPVDKQLKIGFMPQLTRETRTAQEIKDKQILVITGNPPYSAHSKNNGDWIKKEIKKYFFVDGKPLGERNSKTLQDDYVKFIRFAQDKMDKAEHGIVGIITNHSFLDNLTFRGMRQSLMNTFDQLYFIDLHGNAKKKEKTPDGEKDQNVFDIEQGVCISFFIKKNGLKKGIFHADFWGDRETKFSICKNSNFETVDFTELKPNSPFYLFVPQNQDIRAVYEKFWSVKDIFEINNVGIVTSNDTLLIAENKKELEKKFFEVKNSPLFELKKKYNLSENFFNSRKNVFEQLSISKLEIREINYRPFDKRVIWWNTDLIERSRENIMKHFEKNNIGLISVRQVAEGIFNHAFVTNILINYRVTLSNKGGAYLFPLYRYNGGGTNGNNSNYLFKEEDKKDNFTEQFRKFIKTKYKLNKANLSQYSDYEPTPEEIFHYIYAILHSPTFREKYAEFLKMDFPRIPFTENLHVFQNLSGLGKELVDVHLQKNKLQIVEYKNIGNFKGEGNPVVMKPDFRTEKSENETHNRLYINQTHYFESVPACVYNFTIGGYQVLDKYIKDRKNRTLTLDEIENIETIIKALTFTIKQMEIIDSETREWI